MYPYVSRVDIEHIIQAFQHNVNFWYPTMSVAKIEASEARIIAGELDNSTASCLALLMMALGCASQSVSGLAVGTEPTKEEVEYQRSRRALADMYMDGVLKKLHIAHMEVSADATQCLFFTA